MNIDYELKLNNDIKIGWKSNKKDVLRICKENNIDYISKHMVVFLKFHYLLNLQI